MPGPWEKYAQQQQPAQAGPWQRYQAAPSMAEEPPKTQTEATMRRLGFVGPTQEQAGIPRINPQMASPLDAAIGVGDLAISGARALVNKPALTAQSLMHGAFGAISPNDTFRDAFARSQTLGREDIEAGRGIVGSERLRTPQGEILASKLGGLPGIRHVGQAIDWAGNKIEQVAGPEARDVAESALTLGTLGRAPRAVARAPLATAEEVVARSNRGGSAGAAAAATNVAEASPELRQAIVKTGGRRGQIQPEVLQRHVEADTLPVPIRLTEGEATQNPIAISLERNLRGKHTQMAERMNETNQKLGENLQVLRDQVGTEVFSTNPVEHGDTLIRSYRRLDAAVEGEVNRLYKQLRDEMGSRVPVDADTILRNATAELHKRLLFDHAPPAEMATLTRLAQSKNMTFENFEALRTNLARIQRSSADGNVKAAAGIIRNALEDLPLFPGSGAERLKPLADAARAAARRRFQAMEADPAYDAAINGTVPPDRFVQKFVLGAPRDEVDLMLRNLGNFPEARQTVSVAALDHLRDAARLDPNYNGNFSSAGFSRALQGMDAKANIIFDARTAETLSKLRNVANYTTFQPRGSFVNNSNTLVASAAKYGADAVEGAINFAFMGVPVGTFGRRGIEAAGTRRTINRALRPGAGIAAPRNALARQSQNALKQP